MILVDANVPMYLAGAEHPHKHTARRLLDRAVAMGEDLVTDAEVFQEILHRYRAIRRDESIQLAFDTLLGLVVDVLPIELSTVQRAKEILAVHPRMSARGAVHVAVMDQHSIRRIMSFDAGFDVRPDLERLS